MASINEPDYSTAIDVATTSSIPNVNPSLSSSTDISTKSTLAASRLARLSASLSHLFHSSPAATGSSLQSAASATHPASRQHSSTTKRSTCLIIYTGGTIGMSRLEDGSLAPCSGYLLATLLTMPELQHPDIPAIDILEWDKPVDSAEFTPDCWRLIASQIQEFYMDYDGFVILHGTDTLAYTASALSFMFENLGKTVILTGSMIPLSAPVSDAKRNLIVSLLCAANLDLCEVCIFFQNVLLRGNRARKMENSSVSAFASPNFPSLAEMGVRISVKRELLLPAPRKRFFTHMELYRNVAVIVYTPGSDCTCMHAFLNTSTEENPAALILLLYGAGNAPTRSPNFVNTLREGRRQGAVIVILTQCIWGTVDMSQYETAALLRETNCINGKDMTVEACVTKLSVMMGSGLRGEELKRIMEQNIRGEVTERVLQDYNKNEHVYSHPLTAAQSSSGFGQTTSNNPALTAPPTSDPASQGTVPNNPLRVVSGHQDVRQIAHASKL